MKKFPLVGLLLIIIAAAVFTIVKILKSENGNIEANQPQVENQTSEEKAQG
jgi:large-conductance mechanosensitive channel